MTDNSTGQAVPDPGAASPRFPVDSATRPCCGGIGRHARACRRLEAVAGHTIRDRLFDDQGLGRDAFAVAEDVMAALRSACTISTVAELDALPEGSLLASGHCRGGSGTVERGESTWFLPGYECSVDSDMIHLPALLVWHPDWSEQ